jgi:hypothetical protein
MKYAAVIHNVGEVSLTGVADGEYWRERLAIGGLAPAIVDGAAEIMLSATDARFLGVPFCELSISVFVQQRGEGAQPKPRSAVYLTHAYNSSRLLAFCERTFFRTPYFPAPLEVCATDPITVQLGPKAQCWLRLSASALLQSEIRSIAHNASGCWEGPIYLPSVGGKPPELFYAKLSGPTDVYPFLVEADLCELNPTAHHPAIRALVDSRFVPREWSIRRGATHARTKTFRQGAAKV